MTKSFIKRVSLLLIAVFTLIYVNLGATAFASSIAPQTVVYIESEGSYVALDGADPQSIAGRFVQSSVENGYIWVFSSVNNKNVDSALKMLDKELDVSKKEIKDIEDVDAVVLQQAANYLQSDQFSVLRVEIEEKSKETSEQRWQRYLGYAAGLAAVISIFKK